MGGGGGRVRAVAVPLVAIAALAMILGIAAALRWAWSSGGDALIPGDPPPVVRIDLNTADADVLQTLPSIGPTIARRLVAHRSAHGPFRTREDLLRVSGVNEELLKRIQPFLADLTTEGAEGSP